MGTLKGQRARLANELTALLSKPEYSLLLQTEMENNRYRAAALSRRYELKREQSVFRAVSDDSMPRKNFDTGPTTPAEFAERAVNDAFGERTQPRLLDPISVVELKPSGDAPVHLYRAYDGNLAGTLGRWWCRTALLRAIVDSVGNPTDPTSHTRVLEYMKSAMFVHPGWNLGTDIARLTLPMGTSLPVIAGLGNWRAMKAGAKGHPDIHKAEDLMNTYRLLPIPGPEQIFIPFVPAMRIVGVPHLSPDWPFG